MQTMLSAMTEIPKISLHHSEGTQGNAFLFGTHLKVASYASNNNSWSERSPKYHDESNNVFDQYHNHKQYLKKIVGSYHDMNILAALKVSVPKATWLLHTPYCMRQPANLHKQF